MIAPWLISVGKLSLRRDANRIHNFGKRRVLKDAYASFRFGKAKGTCPERRCGARGVGDEGHRIPWFRVGVASSRVSLIFTAIGSLSGR